MGKVQEKAEEIMRREHPDNRMGCPYGRTPRLSDLWECDQEKYIDRAEQELGVR